MLANIQLEATVVFTISAIFLILFVVAGIKQSRQDEE